MCLSTLPSDTDISAAFNLTASTPERPHLPPAPPCLASSQTGDLHGVLGGHLVPFSTRQRYTQFTFVYVSRSETPTQLATLTCPPELTLPTAQQFNECPERYGLQLYPHPTSCNEFYKCANGTLTYEVCENGLLFDGKGAVHNHCNYHWAVDCGERQADLTPLGNGICEYSFGIYSNGACETDYTLCTYGEPKYEPCTPGLAYDERIHGCNWPDLMEYCVPQVQTTSRSKYLIQEEEAAKIKKSIQIFPIGQILPPEERGEIILPLSSLKILGGRLVAVRPVTG
ncbi:hypothetical protein E2C01_028880 [Portunus trituberculatus]|uniref:Chitin-binding type-2 domain-containing protein n=1 Tax=Portunus trituberculatus TaxID=210409 RepID=A0A5B7EQB4_PORTR|nr:hypothetical protein [Portunus trituberculatus]